MSDAERIPDEFVHDLVERRFERIGGVEYAMSSPGYIHQVTAGRLFGQLDAQLSKYGCMPIIAPFDVYPLYKRGDESTFVQPDIFVIRDRSNLEENRYNGTPKFIIEILSSNRSHDMVAKLSLYQKAGVEEYWMVDLTGSVVSVLELINGIYQYHSYTADREVPLISIPGCVVDFGKVFAGA
jgi:Uma2 family endonuclease